MPPKFRVTPLSYSSSCLCYGGLFVGVLIMLEMGTGGFQLVFCMAFESALCAFLDVLARRVAFVAA